MSMCDEVGTNDGPFSEAGEEAQGGAPSPARVGPIDLVLLKKNALAYGQAQAQAQLNQGFGEAGKSDAAEPSQGFNEARDSDAIQLSQGSSKSEASHLLLGLSVSLAALISLAVYI